jgi:hypothetical protein
MNLILAIRVCKHFLINLVYRSAFLGEVYAV